MGFAQGHAMGYARRVYAMREATLGTFVPPTGAGALKTLISKMSFEPGREDRSDARGTRQLLERITSIQKISGSLEGYICPSGTPGTPPNIGTILWATMGKYTNVAATSDTYELDDTQPFTSLLGVAPLSIVHEYSGVLMEAAYGCVVDSFKFSGQGPSAPKFSCDWQGVGHIHTGTSTLPGNTATNSFTVAQADQNNFEVGSVVKIGTNDNGGLGWRITAKSGNSMTIVGTPGVLSGAAVTPFVPTEVTAGSPCSGAVGNVALSGTVPTSYSLTGGGFPLTDYELELKNNVELFYDEAQTIRARDGALGFASIKGSLGFRLRKDLMFLLGNRKTFLLGGSVNNAGSPATVAITITLGTGAGRTCTITLPTCELDPSAVEVPQDKNGTIKLPFTAMGANAMSVAFT